MHNSPDIQVYFEKVWCFVRQVPPGTVVTYGQIASALPEPGIFRLMQPSESIARLVGRAMAACPADVPWHRVINGQGKVSSRADASRQVRMLEAEGLRFIQGKIDLDQYQWHPSGSKRKPVQQNLF
jgi:methylated-DNA-protein-cysteine methyltransferase-like protein